MSQYSSNIQARFTSVLANGDLEHLHAPIYAVVYDNKGLEHIKVEAWDDSEGSGKMNPVVKWVDTILKLWPTSPLMGP